MDENKNVPTQDELDACSTMQDKFKLKPPELFYELNERGLAKLFSEATHPYLRFNTTQKLWMYYNGNRWEEDTSGVLSSRLMKNFTFELLTYAVNVVGTSNENFLELVQSLGTAAKRKSLLKDSVDHNTVSDNDFDTNNYLLNCKNGTFNLMTMQLQPHNADDMITKIIRAEYNPNADTSIISKFMMDIFSNDKELVDYMYRILGYSLSGICKEECLFIFLGETTRNGKSTLLNTFSYLLGESNGYSKSVDVATLGQKKSKNASSPSSDIARLKGSRFVVASEPTPDFIFDEGRIKAFTGQDIITARMLYKNDIEFRPTFKLFIGSNHLPSIIDDSILESRRLRIIPFSRHFGIDEQDKELKERLKQQDVLNALLLQCIEGFRSYMKYGLAEPQAVINATAQYQTQGQLIEIFFDSQLEKNDSGIIPLARFYPKYVGWCAENGFQPLTREKVNNHLRRVGKYKATATIDGRTIRNILTGYQFPSEQAEPNPTDNSVPFMPPPQDNHIDQETSEKPIATSKKICNDDLF